MHWKSLFKSKIFFNDQKLIFNLIYFICTNGSFDLLKQRSDFVDLLKKDILRLKNILDMIYWLIFDFWFKNTQEFESFLAQCSKFHYLIKQKKLQIDRFSNLCLTKLKTSKILFCIEVSLHKK